MQKRAAAPRSARSWRTRYPLDVIERQGATFPASVRGVLGGGLDARWWQAGKRGALERHADADMVGSVPLVGEHGAVGSNELCPRGEKATGTRCSLGRHAEWGGRAWDLCHMTRELTKLDWGTWQTHT